jgi:hypothetical protein
MPELARQAARRGKPARGGRADAGPARGWGRGAGGRAGRTELGADYSSESAALGRRPGQAGPAARRRRLPRGVVVAAVILSIVVGFCGTDSLLGVRDALAAARDAKAQATAVEALLKGGGVTQPQVLAEVRARLQAADADLQRVGADLPAGPILSVTPGVSGPIHALRMATDLVEAGIYGVDSAQQLVPHLKGLLTSIAPSASNAGVGPLTLAPIQRASADIDSASALLQQALQERARVSDGDLRRLGMGSVVPILHQVDAMAPQLPGDLAAVHALMAALPAALGVTKPITYLLFDVDSDELRATGGFQGVYGVLTFSGGRLSSGVHLQNIYGLDCPNGYPDCPVNGVPDRFGFLNTDPTHFGLRDANEDPDYPSSARLDEQLFTQEGGSPVAGVITITPAFVEQILAMTGPLSIPDYGVTVTASNLQEQIHHFHSYASSDATRKQFDGAVGSALLQQVAAFTPAEQSQLVQQALKDLKTRDVQMYFDDPNVEGLLTRLGDDDTLQSPPGDSLMVVETNVSASYVNGDMQETIADSVSLDGSGTATHDLTLTYYFPYHPHTYPADNATFYSDFVRIIVPDGARLSNLSGCNLEGSTQTKHAVWSCRFSLGLLQTETIHATWTVPKATTTAGGAAQYTLLVQKQAGSHDALKVTIAPPKGALLALPPTAPLTLDSSKDAQYAGDLTQDQRLSVQYAS